MILSNRYLDWNSYSWSNGLRRLCAGGKELKTAARGSVEADHGIHGMVIQERVG